MPIPVQNPPQSWYRMQEGLGKWEQSGKVCAVGVGVSPTERRWQGTAEDTIGAYCIIAMRKAMEDAGVSPSEVDGIVFDPVTATGSPWPEGMPIPDELKALNPTGDPLDGVCKLSADYILQNMPELTNVKFIMQAPGCMSHVQNVAIQAVAEKATNVCLVVRGWHNLPGRYYVGRGAAAHDTATGPAKFMGMFGGPACYGTATQFEQYCRRYGVTRDMFANFIINERKNGLMFPEGFWFQHRPDALTREDYLNSQWVAKPCAVLDNDIPIQVAASFLYTTPERAKDMKQKPVYVLSHATARDRARGLVPDLDMCQRTAARNARILYEGAGITVDDLSFENLYEGWPFFHIFFLEGLGGYTGIKEGDALHYFETQDISINSDHPISPSGGNVGSGRSRFWNTIDCIQQIQGRAGKRQIKNKAEIAVDGGFLPYAGWFRVWSATPN